MKLWLLRPAGYPEFAAESNATLDGLPDPWDTPWDKAFGFVIRAATEGEARHIANKLSEGEGRRRLWNDPVSPWLDAALTTCVELTADGPAGAIVKDEVRG